MSEKRLAKPINADVEIREQGHKIPESVERLASFFDPEAIGQQAIDDEFTLEDEVGFLHRVISDENKSPRDRMMAIRLRREMTQQALELHGYIVDTKRTVEAVDDHGNTQTLTASAKSILGRGSPDDHDDDYRQEIERIDHCGGASIHTPVESEQSLPEPNDGGRVGEHPPSSISGTPLPERRDNDT